LEVRCGLSFYPDRTRGGSRTRHLGTQLGGHADGFIVLAPCETHERAVVGIGIVFRKRAQLVEQPPGLVVDEELVREAREGGEMVGASFAARRRHHRLLIPRKQACDLLQIGDADQPFFELC
jgi:hypothetical protein